MLNIHTFMRKRDDDTFPIIAAAQEFINRFSGIKGKSLCNHFASQTFGYIGIPRIKPSTIAH